ncbi:MAG: protein kinase [Planctomycetes bacterium]|nr:protein kinase [Planctomycetota bacterium]MBI3833163.1 protein kinase [Planctomycetota bacterium]
MRRRPVAEIDVDRSGGLLIEYARRQVACAEKVAQAEHPLPPPDSFPGYQVLSEVHRGGQGVVYKAIKKATNREVAIKVLHGKSLATTRDRARFDREVEVLASLRHPHIVGVHDAVTTDSGPFFVMDFVEGRAFDRYISEEELAVADVVRLFVKICDAVNAAHLRGIVHRDLKPNNILIDDHGEPHVLDFGLAKLLDETDSPGVAITETGQFIGSLPWATPEQAQGRNEDVDIRIDVYALGLVLFHALTNEFPYAVSASLREVLDNILNMQPIKPSAIRRGIVDDLDTIVLTCLQKDRERRYQSAGELANDLRRYLAGEPIGAKRDNAWYLIRRAARRHRKLVVAAAVLLALTLTYGAGMTVLYRRATLAEREKAKIADDARSNLRDAQKTIENVVDEVVTRLGELRGGSAARQAILEVAFQGVSGLSEQQSDDPAVQADMARTLHQKGDLLLKMGKVEDGLEQLHRASAIRERLLATRPDDNELRSEFSINLVRIGDGEGQLGHNAERNRYHVQALAIDEELVSREPDNAHFLDNLSWSYGRIASLGTSDLSSRTVFVERQRALAERAVELDPSNPIRLRALRYAFENSGGLANATADWDQAIATTQEECDYLEALVAQYPDNVEYLSRLAVRTLALGGYARDTGDIAGAWKLVREAEAIAERLAADEPDENYYQSILGVVAYTASTLARIDQDVTTRRAYLGRSREILERLASVAPEGDSFYLSVVLQAQAVIEYENGDEENARTLMQRSIAIVREQMAAMPTEGLLDALSELLRDAVPTDLRNTAEAVALADGAVAMSKGRSAFPFHHLALSLAADGQMDRAIEARERVLSLLPSEACSARKYVDRQWSDYLRELDSRSAVAVPTTKGNVPDSEAGAGDLAASGSESVKIP